LHFGANPTLAAAVVVLVALGWLGWPIWLSPWLAGEDALVAWLAPAHPLLALDAVHGGAEAPWVQRRLMYNRLSVLNQDVVYAPPHGILASIFAHGAAAVILAVCVRCAKWSKRRTE
jgi:hypothetical protein